MPGLRDMHTVADARAIARRFLPKIFFDYVDGGAFSEATQRANTDDFAHWTLEQRVLVDVSARDLSTSFLGRRHALPFGLGPLGFCGLYARRGEIQAARAAAAAGVPFCLSSFSIATLAETRAASAGVLQFQLYMLKDRSLSDMLIEQARQAGADALFLTVDTAVTSVRERDERNGFRSATRIGPGLLLSMAMRPRWCRDMLAAGMPQVGHVAGRAEFGRGLLAQAAALSRQIDPSVNWRDVAWLRERWAGKLVIKGILRGDDAMRAVAAGADAVVVSNHGGRQLDGARSCISALPEVARAVAGQVEVLMDGGIRRGGHVVKALALGADAVLLGRAYAYGLAAAGEAGVRRIIEVLAREMDVTLALMGMRSIDELKANRRDAIRPT